MGVISYPMYEVRCDNPDCPGREPSPDAWLDRADAVKEAVAAGWLKMGRKLYCPDCRAKQQDGSKTLT